MSQPTPSTASYEALAAPQEALLGREFPARAVPLPGLVSREGRPVQVVVREAGRGRDAVVLLHGIGSGSASWLNVAREIVRSAPGLRVIAWDAPGYAESTPLDAASPRATDYAARLQALLQALGVQPGVLVGHSLGAFTACASAHGFAASQAHRLVLLSPAGGYGAPGQEETRQKVLAQRLGNLERQGIAGMAEAAGQPGGRMFSASASPEVRAWVRWNMARLVESGYRQAVEMLCADSLQRHAPVAMPVEVHCGDMDIVTPPAACAAIAGHFSASFDLIPGAGHASPIERPEAVAAIIVAAAEQAGLGAHA